MNYKLIHINSYEQIEQQSQKPFALIYNVPIKYIIFQTQNTFDQTLSLLPSIPKYNSTRRIAYFLRGLPQRPAINLSTNDKRETGFERNASNPPTSFDKKTRGFLFLLEDNKLWKLEVREREREIPRQGSVVD